MLQWLLQHKPPGFPYTAFPLWGLLDGAMCLFPNVQEAYFDPQVLSLANQTLSLAQDYLAAEQLSHRSAGTAAHRNATEAELRLVVMDYRANVLRHNVGQVMIVNTAASPAAMRLVEQLRSHAVLADGAVALMAGMTKFLFNKRSNRLRAAAGGVGGRQRNRGSSSSRQLTAAAAEAGLVSSSDELLLHPDHDDMAVLGGQATIDRDADNLQMGEYTVTEIEERVVWQSNLMRAVVKASLDGRWQGDGIDAVSNMRLMLELLALLVGERCSPTGQAVHAVLWLLIDLASLADTAGRQAFLAARGGLLLQVLGVMLGAHKAVLDQQQQQAGVGGERGPSQPQAYWWRIRVLSIFTGTTSVLIKGLAVSDLAGMVAFCLNEVTTGTVESSGPGRLAFHKISQQP